MDGEQVTLHSCWPSFANPCFVYVELGGVGCHRQHAAGLATAGEVTGGGAGAGGGADRAPRAPRVSSFADYCRASPPHGLYVAQVLFFVHCTQGSVPELQGEAFAAIRWLDEELPPWGVVTCPDGAGGSPVHVLPARTFRYSVDSDRRDGYDLRDVVPIQWLCGRAFILRAPGHFLPHGSRHPGKLTEDHIHTLQETGVSAPCPPYMRGSLILLRTPSASRTGVSVEWE